MHIDLLTPSLSTMERCAMATTAGAHTLLGSENSCCMQHQPKSRGAVRVTAEIIAMFSGHSSTALHGLLFTAYTGGVTPVYQSSPSGHGPLCEATERFLVLLRLCSHISAAVPSCRVAGKGGGLVRRKHRRVRHKRPTTLALCDAHGPGHFFWFLGKKQRPRSS